MPAFAFLSPVEKVAEPGEFSLTKSQSALVRSSFDRLAPAAELVATLFFLRLFDLDPSLRAQFPGPIRPHARRFLSTLRLAVFSLNEREGLRSTMTLLGARLRQKGLDASAYAVMSQALIWSLDKSLDREFTYSTRRAWMVFLSQMTRVMAKA